MSYLTNPYMVTAGGVTEFIDNPISDVWTVVNSSLWTIGSGKATADGTANSNPNICRYDLQDTFGSGNNLSDTTWTIRWSAELDIVTGASGFLGQQGNPLPLTEKEIEKIKGQIKDGVAQAKSFISYNIGEKVQVIDGPFASFNGLVEEVDEEKSKLKVSVMIFGRPTPVELEFIQVEKV